MTVLLAEANRESNQIRGDGDAERNNIFAEAFSRDPDFFAFYRSMQAYELGLRGDGTRLVLSPDSDFFRYFQDPVGRGSAGSGIDFGQRNRDVDPDAAAAVRAPATTTQ